jgi:hypothetical protein
MSGLKKICRFIRGVCFNEDTGSIAIFALCCIVFLLFICGVGLLANLVGVPVPQMKSDFGYGGWPYFVLGWLILGGGGVLLLVVTIVVNFFCWLKDKWDEA